MVFPNNERMILEQKKMHSPARSRLWGWWIKQMLQFCFCSHSIAPCWVFWNRRAGLNWGILAPLAPQWLQQGQLLGGARAAVTPGSLSSLAASQAVRRVQTELNLEWARPYGDQQQWVHPGGESKRRNWSLLRTSKRQLEGKGRTGWSPLLPSARRYSSTGACPAH